MSFKNTLCELGDQKSRSGKVFTGRTGIIKSVTDVGSIEVRVTKITLKSNEDCIVPIENEENCQR